MRIVFYSVKCSKLLVLKTDCLYGLLNAEKEGM